MSGPCWLTHWARLHRMGALLAWFGLECAARAAVGANMLGRVVPEGCISRHRARSTDELGGMLAHIRAMLAHTLGLIAPHGRSSGFLRTDVSRTSGF